MSMLFGIFTIIWLVIGVLFSIMAGLTYNFAKRHFNPAWMILLGPLSWPAWQLAEKLEK